MDLLAGFIVLCLSFVRVLTRKVFLMRTTFLSVFALTFLVLNSGVAQDSGKSEEGRLSSAALKQLQQLQEAVEQLKQTPELQNRNGRQKIADVEVFAKAVKWQLQYDEFPKKDYVQQAQNALKTGLERASQLADGKADWLVRPGTSIRGYVSAIDGSVQPYAISLPEGVDPLSGKRWPLYVKLHGRANTMNETNFIHRHEGKALPNGQAWIQLDVYGRGNNAYRWAGETDVFEALRDVERRFRIDSRRITLHGFSMGGAGAWHLGLHHPGQWSSMGAGAGFVDFYRYQKQTEDRPFWQHQNLTIYDTVNYAVNAANLPVVTYGGENDSQLLAGQMMKQAAADVDVDVKLLIGKGMGHKFDEASLNTFMNFHAQASEAGRPNSLARNEIRFSTHTLKYNKCDWLMIHEMDEVYQPTTVEAKRLDDGTATVATSNVMALSLSRDIATSVSIDGSEALPCVNAADGLLPEVFYVKSGDGWQVLNYDDSLHFQSNPNGYKRHNLQGPIDDAFMGPFVCVTPSGQAWSEELSDWSSWTQKRFTSEFHKWMRGRVRQVNDEQLTEDQVRSNHLILFGDPGSNSVIRKVIADLPIEWDETSFTINGTQYDTSSHAFCLIYPNPLNPNRYVVINSGHTFHEKDFLSSNSWLFPRLGDVAVLKFEKSKTGFQESIVWAANFNSRWALSEAKTTP